MFDQVSQRTRALSGFKKVSEPVCEDRELPHAWHHLRFHGFENKRNIASIKWIHPADDSYIIINQCIDDSDVTGLLEVRQMTEICVLWFTLRTLRNESGTIRILWNKSRQPRTDQIVRSLELSGNHETLAAEVIITIMKLHWRGIVW